MQKQVNKSIKFRFLKNDHRRVPFLLPTSDKTNKNLKNMMFAESCNPWDTFTSASQMKTIKRKNNVQREAIYGTKKGNENIEQFQ